MPSASEIYNMKNKCFDVYVYVVVFPAHTLELVENLCFYLGRRVLNEFSGCGVSFFQRLFLHYISNNCDCGY